MTVNPGNLAPLLLKPEEARNLLRLGRNRFYQMLSDGEIRSIRIGHSLRVPYKALEEYVDSRLPE